MRFKTPIEAYEYGASSKKLTRKVLSSPSTSVTLPHTGAAGTLFVAAQIHRWETSATAQISYFPGGGTATAVASPKPGTTINPTTPITINFSKPVSKVLGSHTPTLTPATTGSWKRISSHAIEFIPSGYGYGLDAHVQIAMPNGVRLLGGTSGTATSGSWTVPSGTVTRAQQILADLGYLPVTFKYCGKGVGTTAADQENAAVNTPKGSFSWRYPNTPDQLKEQWQPGGDGVITKGAIMMFEIRPRHDRRRRARSGRLEGADQRERPRPEEQLRLHVRDGPRGQLGRVHDALAQRQDDHHDPGQHRSRPEPTRRSGPTRCSSTWRRRRCRAPTRTDRRTSIPGILWVSYFNGGDALHYYARGSYGFPQSNGCVEMPESAAATIWPYTPIGALVDVST